MRATTRLPLALPVALAHLQEGDMLALAVRELGGIDVLVNNAGVYVSVASRPPPAVTCRYEKRNLVLTTNLPFSALGR